MKQYNLSNIMSVAWRIFRKGVHSFAVALRMAWANAKAHNAAKSAAGINEVVVFDKTAGEGLQENKVNVTGN